jgi:hypothetical protein
MMLNNIKRWHRAMVQKIAVKFGLPEDMSHHHHHSHALRSNANLHMKRHRAFHQRHAQMAKQNAKRLADWQQQHNQRVGDWHARHAAAVMSGTAGLYKWERFVYKNVSRIAKMAK